MILTSSRYHLSPSSNIRVPFLNDVCRVNLDIGVNIGCVNPFACKVKYFNDCPSFLGNIYL